ncbi:aldo/keto reductase, partial [candidate division KSB1 bacterium]|nr:aldo/keto reductase [candidate division KSB1 bacterium]
YPKAWYVPIDINDTELAQKALSWTYAQGVTAAIPPGEPMFWDHAFRIAANVSELSESDIEQLRQKADGIELPIFPEI